MSAVPDMSSFVFRVRYFFAYRYRIQVIPATPRPGATKQGKEMLRILVYLPITGRSEGVQVQFLCAQPYSLLKPVVL